MSSTSLPEQLARIAKTHDRQYETSLGLLKKIFEELDPQYQERAPAAVCVLFRGETFLQSEVLLTLRSASVATHANQVAFPGGSFDAEDGADPVRAALRECREEVGLHEHWIEPHGLLDPYPTLGGSFIVHPVVATLHPERWGAPFESDPSEVVFAEWVSVSKLLQSRQVEEREIFGNAIKAPYFMWGDKKMWGLSAWIFDSILNRYVTISL